MSGIRMKGISKNYDRETVLADTGLVAPDGKVTVLIGPSGCGKTTLLKIAAGLVKPDAGSIYFDDELVNAMSPAKRGIVYLSQEPLLFPHLSVYDNVAFGLEARKMARDEVRDRVEDILRDVGLLESSAKLPEQLSGGQKQRVAFARALVIEPRAVLLDEPFGSLDAYSRSEMQDLFRRILDSRRTTALFVTHDLREALTIGERFALIDRGKVLEFDSAREFIEDSRSGVATEFEFWKSWIEKHE